MDGPRVYQLGTLGVAALAAMFDWRTGRIPNWLTIGAVATAIPVHAWITASFGGDHGPLEGVKWSVLGALVCCAPLALGWRFGWIAGGDVKLVAAMGAFGGLSLGLEAVFLALLCAASFLVLRLAWNGSFFSSLGDSLAVTVGRMLSRRKNIVFVTPQQSTMRFGPFACAGAALSLALHGGFA